MKPKKTNGNNANSGSNAQEAKKQNTVEIFIQDANNKINTAYRTFKISANVRL